MRNRLDARADGDSVTLREAYETYVQSKKLCADVRRSYRTDMEKWLADWLDQPITSITADMVEQRHKQLLMIPTIRGTHGKARADDTCISLGAVLRFASERFSRNGQPLLKTNPVRRLTLNRAWHKKEARHEIIPDENLHDFYVAVSTTCNTILRDFFVFLLLTGMSQNEAKQLRWCMINLDEGNVSIPPRIARFGRGYSVPLAGAALHILQNRLRERAQSDWVFPSHQFRFACNSGDQIGAMVQRIREKSGLRFYTADLRRTFLSKGRELGINYVVLKTLTNQPVNDITAQYIVLDNQIMRDASEQISRSLIALMRLNLADMDEPRRNEEALKGDCRQLLLTFN